MIAAYLTGELDGGRVRTVRELVSEFNGLSASAKQKAVAAAANLSGATLRDLVRGNDVDLGMVERLLAELQAQARPIKPQALGVLGKPHLAESLVRHYYVADESVRYEKALGEADGLPFVLEVAFGVKREDFTSCGRDVVVGLNWSPTLRSPLTELDSLLGENRVDRRDPVSLVVHLACPRLEYTDRGKTRLALPSVLQEALARCIRAVTREWKAKKRQADQQDRLNERQLEEMRKARRSHLLNVKEASYQVMVEAYLEASTDKRFPGLARMIMYAARPRVLPLTGGKWVKNSETFTQDYLPAFMRDYPELTADWDVIWDARGHLIEPHTGRSIDLGGLAVRRYRADWLNRIDESVEGLTLDHACPTVGPSNRFQAVLFIEKEGFHELLKASGLLLKYDLALMSTKGVSVTAARQLVQDLSGQGVPTFVLHDFDKTGFTIINTLRSDTQRFRFRSRPQVIDLGLRLQDVEALDGEPTDQLAGVRCD